MNRELRQSARLLSSAALRISQALENNAPRLGNRLYKNGDIISAVPLGRNSNKESPYDGRMRSPIHVDEDRQVIRYNHEPIGADILLDGRSIYANPAPSLPLRSVWLFAEATYAGGETTTVNRPDPEVEVDPEDTSLCNYPTWVNFGRLASSVSIVALRPGSVPADVFDPHPFGSIESTEWSFSHFKWGVAERGTRPDTCPPPDPEPPGWEPGSQIVQSPKSVTIRSIVGSVYRGVLGGWSTSSRLFYDGELEWSPDNPDHPFPAVNYGFTPYLQFLLSHEAWG